LNLPEGLHVVGRLDRDSEGLLLLTDDGQFTSAVAEPRQKNGEQYENGCCKTYWALVKGSPDETALDRMRRGGLIIRGAKTRPPIAVNVLLEETAKLLPKPVLGMDRAGTWLEIILKEGRNRQVRRITADAGHPTIRLVRVSIGLLSLFDESSNIMLQPGEWRYIKKGEVLPTLV
jgi:23S rRNA pseudouridine2457 synthase